MTSHKMNAPRICSIEGCDKPHRARGWCSVHYMRWRAHGDPLICLNQIPPHGEAQRYFGDVVLAYEGDDCLTWPYARSVDGYGMLGHKVVSRLVCEEVNGPPPTPIHQAAHSCGNGKHGCVTKGHLSWKTPAENEADKVIHGTVLRGEANPAAKLTREAVRAIRALSGTQPKTAIAEQFCVSIRTVGLIQSGERWGWMP